MDVQQNDIFEMADAILSNALGISFQQLRAAKVKADPAEVARSSERFNACYARRQTLRLADDATLQSVIDSVGPAVRDELLADV